MKRLLASDTAAADKAKFVREIQTLQFASAACQRVCRMLGCCNLDGGLCVVMSLYKSSAAQLLQQAGGEDPIEWIDRMFCRQDHICSEPQLLSPTFLGTLFVPCSCAGPLPLSQLVSLALEILEGLAELHEADILHLDLKPANVLLDKHGHAYLSDFGISRAISTLQSCTAQTSIVGTPHYL